MCSTKFIIFAAFGLCILASTVFGHGSGGRGYHGFGKFSRYGNLTQEQRQELKELKQTLKLGNATKQQYRDSLQSFFEGVGGDSLTRFNEKQAKIEAHKIQFSNFTANSNLSDATKNFITQIQAIKDNMQITKAEEKKQIKELFKGASDDVKQELKSLHPHGKRWGGFNGGRGQRFSSRRNGGVKRPQPPTETVEENVVQ